ncbi:adrenodoxin-like protein 2, mitochondrial isoform X2 [Capsicum galapagoense]
MVVFHVHRIAQRLNHSTLSSVLLHDSGHVSLLKMGSSRSINTAAKFRTWGLLPSNCSNVTSPCTSRTSYGPLSRYQIFLGLRHNEYCTTPGNEKKQTISATFVDKDGEEKQIKVPVGMSLLEAAHENDIELEGACEGSLACSTCHVIVMDVDYYNKLEDPTDEENDMLDLAFGLTETSRLGCQVIAKPELDGIRVALPAATRNFAVDGFKPKPH